MIKTISLRSILLAVAVCFAAFQTAHAVSCADAMIDMSGAGIDPNYCVFLYRNGIGGARGMDLAPNGDLLVLARDTSTILAVWENDANETEAATLFSGSLALNHALRYHDGYIYASSDQNVYRWPYPAEKYRMNLGQSQVVLQGMPAKGNHETRTLEFDDNDRVYVNIGSALNIDSDSSRSRVIRFTLDGNYPKAYSGVQVFADGTRNEVGLRFDNRGRLWGVENGLDNLGIETRTEFGDIHNTNPSEEVNIFLESDAGEFYGYPFCWSEGPGLNGELSFSQGLGAGTQWATSSSDSTHTDQWCRNVNNNIAPVYNLPAHIAPLDITFYNGDRIPGKKGRVAIIPSHGSWNRSPSKGRMILFLNLDDNGNPTDYEQIFWGLNPENFFIRPVAVVVGPCKAYGECIFFSDDRLGAVYALAYIGPEGQIPVAPRS